MKLIKTLPLIALTLLSLIYSQRNFAKSETVFTYRTPESSADQRYKYDTEVLQLALEKTKAKYGPYKLVGSPVMNFARAMSDVSSNAYPNFFIQQSYEDRFSKMNMDYVKFPVELGIIGWRVCFANADSLARLKNVTTLAQLKELTHGQGIGWTDVQILRANGFQVTEAPTYEGLFKMVASKRFDLFCRGTNELLEEWNEHKQINGLTFDKTITIEYPMPRVFYTNSANKAALQRVQEGLIAAYKDGSLIKVWEKNYKSSIDFVALQNRKAFHIENPFLKNFDADFKQYYYDPFKSQPKK